MNIRNLSIEERLQLVEDIRDSIAAEQGSLPLSEAQRAELDRRLAAYRVDKDRGRDAFTALECIRAAGRHG
jgi:putative addiction module component (TIGR02574 family)